MAGDRGTYLTMQPVEGGDDATRVMSRAGDVIDKVREKESSRPLQDGSRGHASGPLQPDTSFSGAAVFGYPRDLAIAQEKLSQVHDALSLGWPPDDSMQIAHLRAQAAGLVSEIVSHSYWLELDPSEVLLAWNALTHRQE